MDAVFVTLLLALGLNGVSGKELNEGLAVYYSHVEKGRFDDALRDGLSLLERTDWGACSSDADSAALRVKVIQKLSLSLTSKLDLIAYGVNGRPSIFAYCAPNPREFYEGASRTLAVRNVPGTATETEQQRFFDSLVMAATRRSDQLIRGSWEEASGRWPDDEAESKARAYLSAYILAVHTKDLPVAATDFAATLGYTQGAWFVVEDALAEICVNDALVRAVEEIERAGEFRRPETEEFLKAIESRGRRIGDLQLVSYALEKMSESNDNEKSDEALYSLIKIAASRAKTAVTNQDTGASTTYEEAEMLCERYLEKFSRGKHRNEVEYLIVLCAHQSGRVNRALLRASDYLKTHQDSLYVPNIMLIAGIAQNKSGNDEEAIAVFQRVVQQFPATPQAGQAQFLTGCVYHARGEFSNAAKHLQHFVDFYPSDPSVDRARAMLEDARSK